MKEANYNELYSKPGIFLKLVLLYLHLGPLDLEFTDP